MDLGKVFKVMNYVVMVLGGLLILIAILAVAGVGLATSGTDDITQGGATFFTMFLLLPAILQGVIGVLAGRAGLQSDPDRCRKLSITLAVISVLAAFSAAKSGSLGFMNILSIAIYGFYCYLAHTQSY
ncbi:MAG: hypothetical protein IKQ91_00420 [Oscillospiraceae bacterium]|nr:hypothetical protein [Oscillospiraceae bacterium]